MFFYDIRDVSMQKNKHKKCLKSFFNKILHYILLLQGDTEQNYHHIIIIIIIILIMKIITVGCWIMNDMKT